MIQEARQTSKYISLTVEKEVLERNNLTSWVAVVAQQENWEGRYHSMIQEARQTLSKYTSLTVEKEVLERNNQTSWEAVVAQQENWEGRYHSMIQEARQTCLLSPWRRRCLNAII